MSADIFLDSNIFIYAIDSSAPAKQSVARRVIAEKRYAISTQVLGEFYVNATRKIPVPLDHAVAVAEANRWCQLAAVPVVPIDKSLVNAAFEIQSRWQLSYWDALVIAAASKAACPVLLSEDLNAGETIAGVTITNPFAALV
ncbi:MAG: PIN domain-containing protein [Bifidobacteriaceae bacterium]|jgi:predicted nucleic acid-binding protein|nr:PIN domain-containing protein [Bifidobacteriaceae bacterium]